MSANKISVNVTSENSKGNVPAVQFNDPSIQKLGVIVLQEWWGMNQHIQDTAQDFANRGNFTTIVPDLYRGEIATDHEHAGHLMSGLDWPGAVKDIQGCARHLKNNGCSKVGVIGFCMGGALSLAAAALVPEICASAPFYGIPSPAIADVTKIEIPVQCHFGEDDNLVGFSSRADQEKLKEMLKSGNVPFDFFSYKAGHAFANATGPNYNKEMAELAIRRSVEFFQSKLA